MSVKRGSDNLLNNIDFTLNSGEHLAIIGPSGSGKSLLAMALKGQILHTGTIEYEKQRTYKTQNRLYYKYICIKNKSNVSDFIINSGSILVTQRIQQLLQMNS